MKFFSFPLRGAADQGEGGRWATPEVRTMSRVRRSLHKEGLA